MPENKKADIDELKNEAGSIVEEVTERGYRFVNAAKSQVADYADRRKNETADAVTGLAKSLRESGQKLDDRPHVSTMIDSAADSLDQVADTIRQGNVGEWVGQMENLARQRPATIVAAGIAAGFALSRFLKSSSEAAQRQSEGRRQKISQG